MSDQDYSSDFSESDSSSQSSASHYSAPSHTKSRPTSDPQTVPIMQSTHDSAHNPDVELLQQKQNQISRLEGMLAAQTDEHIAAQGKIRHEAEQKAKKAAKVSPPTTVLLKLLKLIKLFIPS